MSLEIQHLLSNIQIVASQKSNIIYERLDWKYGTILFTQYEPNESFIKDYLNLMNSHNLLLTTFPFHTSDTIPSFWIESLEKDKSLGSIQKITSFLIKNNATRNSHFIIKGGGLLMDMGGFAASIYMRGLKNVTLIPTTLLGMVDATVGGKTAINYSNTKNLLGTIRNPNQIIIYPGFLSTQTQRQFFNGMAETIKMAITYDQNFFEFIEELDFKTLRNLENFGLLQKLIKRSLAIKILVVEKDLTQQNERKWLNFGHTIGHGIELDESNTLLHGQCVAIGMVKALELSIAKGIICDKQSGILARLKKILKKLNLPTQIPEQVNIEKMIQRMLKDKKISESTKEYIDFVFIESIGKRCLKPTKITVEQLKTHLGNAVEVSYPHNTQIIPINDTFPFPSSKSISLRYLYISCLAVYHSSKSPSKIGIPQKIVLTNFLSSQDTEKMIYSLKQLGFILKIDHLKRQLSILGYQENKQGELDVGNSGITARFILPLCFMIKGKWKINCHKRMEQRPNQQIFQLCSQHFQAVMKYLNKDFSFPVQIISEGKYIPNKPLIVQGKQSSQFISSAMINWAFLQRQTQILLKSAHNQSDDAIVSESYLLMTTKCLQSFGISSKLDKKARKITINSINMNLSQQIHIQNDLSTYSYPYIFYEFHGFPNKKIYSEKFMQGDVLFYEYVEILKSQLRSNQKVIRFDFNNCTDTFMTFMVFCCSDQVMNSGIQRIVIQNIANQRVKESNRIDLTIKNLKKIGVQVEQFENRVEMIIRPLEVCKFEQNKIIFETYEDHRLAMSFGVLSTYLSKKYPNVRFIIDSKKAVEKTFPQFWKYFHQSNVKLKFFSTQQFSHKNLNIIQKQQNSQLYSKYSLNEDIVRNSIFIIGNRGSGKTTIGRNVSKKINFGFVDLDDLITEKIKTNFRQGSIQKMVERYGWDEFRNLESQVLQQTMSSLRYSVSKHFIISTGGGILERQLNRMAFERERANIFYLQRPFSHLKAFQSANRPAISNFERVSRERQPVYQSISHQIITFPHWLTQEQQAVFVLDSIKKYLGQEKKLQKGYILCLGEEILTFQSSLTHQEIQQVKNYQIRVDKLLTQTFTLKHLRQVISKWRLKYPNKDFILTLRTKKQFGQFIQNNAKSYPQMIKNLTKIPCDFLDHQISHQPDFTYNYNKLLHSYHGNDEKLIQKLMRQSNGFKKFCLTNSSISNKNLYEKYHSKFQSGICIDLSNPLTRLKTDYQMIIPEHSFKGPSPTGIMTLPQMRALKKLFRL